MVHFRNILIDVLFFFLYLPRKICLFFLSVILKKSRIKAVSHFFLFFIFLKRKKYILPYRHLKIKSMIKTQFPIFFFFFNFLFKKTCSSCLSVILNSNRFPIFLSFNFLKKNSLPSRHPTHKSLRSEVLITFSFVNKVENSAWYHSARNVIPDGEGLKVTRPQRSVAND